MTALDRFLDQWERLSPNPIRSRPDDGQPDWPDEHSDDL